MLQIALKKIFFKLVNNSVFGKTMKNLIKRVKIRLANNDKDYRKYVSFVSEKYLIKILLVFIKLYHF